MRKRTGLTVVVALVGALALATLASYGAADSGKRNLKSKRMSSFYEVPSISTAAKGSFEAKIQGSTIEYKLKYSGLSSAPSVAHIHLGQRSANGGFVAYLCGGGGKPACPASGTVTGTIAAADIQALTVQGIAAGEIGEVIAAMRAGYTYANVHTALFAGGELRGQINDDNQKDD